MRMVAVIVAPCFFYWGFVPPCHRGMTAARSSDLRLLPGTGVMRALSAGGCAPRSQTMLAAGRGGLLPRDKLLKQAQYEGMEKGTAAKLLDGADSALRGWFGVLENFYYWKLKRSTYKTGFLPPPDVAVMRKLLDPLLDVDISSWGGHDQAERQRLFISREGGGGDFAFEEEVEALEIGGQFLFDMANHRDYLGSILGTGITRGGIGDILVQGERGAQVMVDPVMAEHLCQSLTSVRSVTVKVRRILMEELSVGPAKHKDVSTVEASLRLDSVASAGMGMSRSKMAAAIKSGLVLVNWKTAASGTSKVKEGDVVTVRGKGRVKVVDITFTKKGRYKIHMTRTK